MHSLAPNSHEKIRESICNGWITKINDHAALCAFPYETFGFFGLVTYPLYYFIWKIVGSGGYENLYLRLIAAGLCILLLLKKKWPVSIKRFYPLFWYLTLIYSLPFLFTFFLLKNNFSNMWVLNSITVLVLGILLLDSLALMIVLSIGIILGYLFFIATGNLPSASQNILLILITYGSVLIFGALFARKREHIHNQDIHSTESLGASIAHEMRTPLSAIHLAINSVKEFLPALIGAYEVARDAKLSVSTIRPLQIEYLKRVLDKTLVETESANMVIDMLQYPDRFTRERISISTCVDQALRRYPFKTGERSLLSWEANGDFEIETNPLLMIHVVFNLLKNALYYIRVAGKGAISIVLQITHDRHLLIFTDTGQGIPKKYRSQLFKQFFSKTPHGTGLGLYFCKTVMLALGGDIRCKSEEGEYTQFTLFFPKLETQPLHINKTEFNA